MPAEARLGMPSQDLDYAPPRPPTGPAGSAVWFARIILVTTFVGITTYGVYQMLQVVRFASMTLLQGLMIFFFGVSLAWIAFSAGSVLAGASKRRDPRPEPAAGGTAGGGAAAGLGETLTALVMPIYNEDPTRTTAALQAMSEALQKTGASRGFEIVVLSDSTDADAWIRETAAVERLRRALAGKVPLW
jgi:membrane glycosyltransferase